MKFFHLSDLHLGLRINSFSLLEDQEFILNRLLELADIEKPDCVLLSGDIYDKPSPPPEAVALLDGFLTGLASRGVAVLAIAGNHDSPERIAFGSKLMNAGGVYFSPVYSGEAERVTLSDRFGEVNFYLLPFVRPAAVRRFFPEAQIESSTDAVRAAIGAMNVGSGRNVLLAHQFVIGAEGSGSEDASVGGSDGVDVSAFDGFSYVALGHIHGAQRVGREAVRYCGTPLKYSLSEIGYVKSASVVTLGADGEADVRTVPLKPLRDMRRIRGSYDELTARRNYIGTPTEDYLHVVLEDEEDLPDAIGRLRSIYPNILQLSYDNARTRAEGAELSACAPERSPAELFSELYERQNGRPPSGEQLEYLNRVIDEIWNGGGRV